VVVKGRKKPQQRRPPRRPASTSSSSPSPSPPEVGDGEDRAIGQEEEEEDADSPDPVRHQEEDNDDESDNDSEEDDDSFDEDVDDEDDDDYSPGSGRRLGSDYSLRYGLALLGSQCVTGLDSEPVFLVYRYFCRVWFGPEVELKDISCRLKPDFYAVRLSEKRNFFLLIYRA